MFDDIGYSAIFDICCSETIFVILSCLLHLRIAFMGRILMKIEMEGKIVQLSSHMFRISHEMLPALARSPLIWRENISGNHTECAPERDRQPYWHERAGKHKIHLLKSCHLSCGGGLSTRTRAAPWLCLNRKGLNMSKNCCHEKKIIIMMICPSGESATPLWLLGFWIVVRCLQPNAVPINLLL